MKDTLLFLLNHIVENQEALSVEEQNEDGKIVLLIHVAPEDMGKVIGKQGRIIRALRDLIKVMAVKENQFVDVVVAE